MFYRSWDLHMYKYILASMLASKHWYQSNYGMLITMSLTQSKYVSGNVTSIFETSYNLLCSQSTGQYLGHLMLLMFCQIIHLNGKWLLTNIVPGGCSWHGDLKCQQCFARLFIKYIHCLYLGMSSQCNLRCW